MILVLLGTQNNSFHRLLEEIEKLIAEGIIKEKVIVQAGYTKYQSDKMEIFDLIAKQDLEKYQNEADLIITHGGVGSIMSSISKGKKVIAVPRLHKYNEHVNDHQKEIVQLFDKKGCIIGIGGVKALKKAIQESENFVPKEYENNNKKMLGIIENFIDKV
jgi:UDP-N-acetylglucosamine transferase subunit ALG13